MRLPLDTNTLLWAVAGVIDDKSASLIDDDEHTIFYSTVNIWEIVIKKALDKSGFDVDMEVLLQFLNDAGYKRLDITEDQILMFGALPMIHKDPFDRLLIAQTIYERMTLMASDDTLGAYGISTLRSSPNEQKQGVSRDTSP